MSSDGPTASGACPIYIYPPLVSIVVLGRGGERHLRGAIDSAWRQTYPHLQVVVVDDGTSESSRDAIRSYGSAVTPVCCAEGGEAQTVRAGLAACRGDIVLFLDSRDTLDPHAAKRLMEEWRPGSVKAQFYLRSVSGTGRPLGRRLPNIDFVADGDVRRCLFLYGYYPSPPTTGSAYTRAFLAEVLSDEANGWRDCVDGYLSALAPLHGDVVQIAAEMGSYREHERARARHPSSVGELREGILREIDRERVLLAHAATHGITLTGPLAVNIPAHCKARILSLRLDRATHPVAGDTLPRLLALGVRSVWRFPHMRVPKRLVASAGFLALLVLPRGWLERSLAALFAVEYRPRPVDFARAGAEAATAGVRAAAAGMPGPTATA
ncbi:MAG: glycosyltransferase family 2 protein [Gemmatimonas sp.]